MSIVFPNLRKLPERRFADSGVRGRFEKSLRTLRGAINTTTPTIESGKGFTVAKNATGDVTITFDPPFSGVPSFTATSGLSNAVLSHNATPTASTVRVIQYVSTTGAAADGAFYFVVMGPA